MGSPSVPQAPSTGNAQSIFNSGLNTQYGIAGQAAAPVAGIVNNQYAGGYQTGANLTGSQAQTGSGNLFSSVNSALPYGQQILTTAFDPQNALYARTQQQVQDQAGAQLAASGVGSTPFGQGVMGQDLSNFNIDWQNNQLSRESQGLSSYDSLLGSAASGYGAATNLGASGAALPYDTSNAINNASLGALQTEQGLYNTPTQTAGNWVQQVFGDQMQQYGAEEAQNQSFWGDIGGIAGTLGGWAGLGNGGLGSLFGGGGGGGGDYGATTYLPYQTIPTSVPGYG
jgi:hypothetical protein